MRYTWLNNRLLPTAEALIPVTDRGFKYGDGVFETIAVHGGVPYQFAWHMERLRHGLAAIRIECGLSDIQAQCRQLLEKNAVRDGLLRLQVTRGSGGAGYLPDAQSPPTLVIQTLPMPQPPQAPVSLWLSGYEKISPRALPVQYKTCQGLNSTLARLEASEHGCFEALLLNGQGHVTETASGNIFWLHDDVLHTPALSCGVLEGGMRAAIIRLSPYEVREVAATPDALAGADAVLISNVVWKALAVNRLLPTSYQWKSEAIVENLRRLLAEDINGYCKGHAGDWQ
jgi:branched-chain amino acid aminotransferase